MNKEIVKRLKDSLDYEFDLSFNERRELLSYIEQLEKEIERQSKLQVIQDDEITEANDSITWWQNRYNAIVNQNDDNYKKVVKLENNRDKAIEYIANIICDEKARVRHDLCGKDIDGLINILKGGSDE